MHFELKVLNVNLDMINVFVIIQLNQLLNQ